jgi:hypothetical protein
MLPASNSHTILPVPLLAGSYGTEGSEPLEWTLRLRLRASPVRNKTAFLSDVVASRDHLPRQTDTRRKVSQKKRLVLRIGFTHWFHALVSRIGFHAGRRGREHRQRWVLHGRRDQKRIGVVRRVLHPLPGRLLKAGESRRGKGFILKRDRLPRQAWDTYNGKS